MILSRPREDLFGKHFGEIFAGGVADAAGRSMQFVPPSRQPSLIALQFGL